MKWASLAKIIVEGVVLKFWGAAVRKICIELRGVKMAIRVEMGKNLLI